MAKSRHRSRARHLLPLALVACGALGLGPGCASTHPESRDGYTGENERSPIVATLLAIFPGFFVHGIGNSYAGRSSRADELMLEEGLGVGCMAVGAGLAGLGYYEHTLADKADGATEILHRIGEGTSFAGAAGFGGFGLVLFFDSWIRDIAEAGDAADQRNRDLRRNYDLTRTVPEDRAADITTAGAPSVPPQRPYEKR